MYKSRVIVYAGEQAIACPQGVAVHTVSRKFIGASVTSSVDKFIHLKKQAACLHLPGAMQSIE